MIPPKRTLIFAAATLAVASALLAQGRFHTTNRAGMLLLQPATQQPPAESEVSIRDRGTKKSIRANSIPDHLVGQFPNAGNPNTIREQQIDILIPEDPRPAREVTYMHGSQRAPKVFGITLDGVLMEPGAAEVWKNNRFWQYEPLSGAIDLGLDENHAHVQPTGLYHYHGLPTGLMSRLGFQEGAHSPLIGWAADGYPIYVRYGYSDPQDPSSGIVDLTSSYQLKVGDRPAEPNGPGGTYDGAFIRDYEWVQGSGDLDECNGRFCVTPDFPEGTYAYFMTDAWPVIPRAWRGTPIDMVPKGGGGGMGRPPGGPHPHPPHGSGKGKGKSKGKGGHPPKGRPRF